MGKDKEIKKLEDQKKKADKSMPKLSEAIKEKLKEIKSGKPVTK